MNLKQLVSSTMLAILISFPAAAQSPAPQETPEKEQQEARKELEQKALALVEDVLTDAQNLKSPLSRVRIIATVADLLWPRDEARARALFKEVIADFTEFLKGIDGSDPQFFTFIQAPSQLRHELLQILARRDGQMALYFLHSTRIPQLTTSGFQSKDYELNLEMMLAYQIAANNPKLALKIALDSMDEGYSYNLVNLLTVLREKDRESAAKLASEITRRLQSENLLKSQEAAGVAVNLLVAAKGDEAHGPSSGQAPAGPPLLDAQAYRDLMDLVISAASRAQISFNPSDWRERNALQNILGGLTPLMSEIEKYAPSSVPMIRRKMADFKRVQDPYSRMWQDYQELFEKGSADDILAIAPKVGEDQRQQVYQQAAWKAFKQGNDERARQIVNDNISNPIERQQMLEQFDQQTAMKAIGEGKPEAARQLITRLRTNENRASMLAQLANAAASKGDKKTALQLLDEARSLFGNRAESISQMGTLLNIARAYAPLEPARGFEIVDAVTTQLNDLLAAAEVLNGFDQQYYRDGELVWQSTSLSNMVTQTANELGQLARTDFDRAREIAAKFQRPEARLLARLMVAQAALSGQNELSLPVQGRRVMSFAGK